MGEMRVCEDLGIFYAQTDFSEIKVIFEERSIIFIDISVELFLGSVFLRSR